MKTRKTLALLLAVGLVLALGGAARAAFVAYHDLGATTGQESTGNITTHQSGPSGTSTNPLDTTPKSLIKYSDGTPTGVSFSVAGANAMDSRSGVTGPPAAGTPADALFNVAGLNLNNGLIYEGGNNGSGSTTFTLTGLQPSLTYDVALYGHRSASNDGVERFTLAGADAATNSSSTGIVGPFVADMNTRPNQTTGDVVRWTGIDPGADGAITIDIDPEVTSPSNIAYLSALRLEEAGAAPPPPAVLKVDLNGQSGPNQSGYTAWNFASGFTGPLNESNSFSFPDATDGTVEVNLSTATNAGSRNYGIDQITDPGNLTIPDVWKDLAFFNNNASGSMTLTLDDLKAGTYNFTSYSYADNLSDGGTNDEGTASVLVDTGSGFVDTGLDVTLISGLQSTVSGPTVEAADLDAFGTVSFQFTVPNDGDTVRILYDNLTGGDTFGLNAFELESAGEIPEPASVFLVLLGLGALGRYRRRRSRRA